MHRWEFWFAGNKKIGIIVGMAYGLYDESRGHCSAVYLMFIGPESNAEHADISRFVLVRFTTLYRKSPAYM